MQANETNETTAASRHSDPDLLRTLRNLDLASTFMSEVSKDMDAQQSGLAAVWAEKALSIQNSIKTLTILVREGWDAQ